MFSQLVASNEQIVFIISAVICNILISTHLMLICRPNKKKGVLPVKRGVTEPTECPFEKTQEDNRLIHAEVHSEDDGDVEIVVPEGLECPGTKDESAAAEALRRHNNNIWWPQLEIQKKRITDNSTKKELAALLKDLPPHPTPEKVATMKGRRMTKELEAKYKDMKVTFNNVGIVYFTRCIDPCRNKEDNSPDTADTSNKEADNAPMDGTDPSKEKMPSEIPMTPATKTEAKDSTQQSSVNPSQKQDVIQTPVINNKKKPSERQVTMKTQEERTNAQANLARTQTEATAH